MKVEVNEENTWKVRIKDGMKERYKVNADTHTAAQLAPPYISTPLNSIAHHCIASLPLSATVLRKVL